MMLSALALVLLAPPTTDESTPLPAIERTIHWTNPKEEIDLVEVERLEFTPHENTLRVRRTFLGTRIDGKLIPPSQSDPEEFFRFAAAADPLTERINRIFLASYELPRIHWDSTDRLPHGTVTWRPGKEDRKLVEYKDQAGKLTGWVKTAPRFFLPLEGEVTANDVRMPDSDLRARLTVTQKLVE